MVYENFSAWFMKILVYGLWKF